MATPATTRRPPPARRGRRRRARRDRQLPAGRQPGQTDTDGDGIGDACEAGAPARRRRRRRARRDRQLPRASPTPTRPTATATASATPATTPDAPPPPGDDPAGPDGLDRRRGGVPRPARSRTRPSVWVGTPVRELGQAPRPREGRRRQGDLLGPPAVRALGPDCSTGDGALTSWDPAGVASRRGRLGHRLAARRRHATSSGPTYSGDARHAAASSRVRRPDGRRPREAEAPRLSHGDSYRRSRPDRPPARARSRRRSATARRRE